MCGLWGSCYSRSTDYKRCGSIDVSATTYKFQDIGRGRRLLTELATEMLQIEDSTFRTANHHYSLIMHSLIIATEDMYTEANPRI